MSKHIMVKIRLQVLFECDPMMGAKLGGFMAKGKVTPMTTSAVARIQSASAKAGNGGVQKGSFAARVQSAAAKNGKH